jgi:hypothetical protein
MSDNVSRVGFGLDEQVSGPASKAADALDHMRESLEKDTASLRKLDSVMGNIRKTGGVSAEVWNRLQNQHDQLSMKVKQGRERYISLGGSFEQAEKQAVPALQSITEVQGALSTAMHGNVQGSMGFVKSMGLVAGAALLAVAAMVAIAGAVAHATQKLVQFAFASANAIREEKQHWEAVATGARLGETTLMKLYKGPWTRPIAPNAGDQLYESVKSVAAASSLSTEEVGGLAASLYKARLSGEKLKIALQAAATAQSVQGPEAANAIIMQARNLNLYGMGVKDLAKRVEGLWGAQAKAKLLNYNVQLTKARANISKLFADVKITPFLEGLRSVLKIFDQSTASGKALKTILDKIVQPIIDGATKAMPIVKMFFKGMIIGALMFVVAILRVKNFLEDVFGSGDWFQGIDMLDVALYTGIAVAGLFGAAILAVGIALADLAVPIALVVGFFAAIVVVVKRVTSFFLGIDWKDLGSSVVRGIAEGIVNGASWVYEAISGLGDKVKAWFKDAFKIHSPSRISFGFGRQLDMGLAQGIHAGMGDIRKELAPMSRMTERAFQPQLMASATVQPQLMASATVQPFRAAAEMSVPAATPAMRSPGTGATVQQTINVTIEAKDAKEITSDSFVAKLTGILEHACHDVAINISATEPAT